MLNEARDDLALPLASMNPMGHEHLGELLDAYLELDVEGLAAASVARLARELPKPGRLRVALVLIDDLRGAWTNRWDQEMKLRFESEGLLRRGWIVAPIWSREPVCIQRVLQELSCAVRRAEWQRREGAPKSLLECMAQEGRVLADAGWDFPGFSEDELVACRAVLEPHFESRCFATKLAGLFGDEAAESLGMERLGLRSDAGLAVALWEELRLRRG